MLEAIDVINGFEHLVSEDHAGVDSGWEEKHAWSEKVSIHDIEFVDSKITFFSGINFANLDVEQLLLGDFYKFAYKYGCYANESNTNEGDYVDHYHVGFSLSF